MLRFHVGPFPVRVEASFLIVALLFGGLGSQRLPDVMAWVFVVFLSVLIHELGHALVGRAQGGTPEIVLQGMGGVTFPRHRSRITPWQRILLSAAGPFAGLVPGALALLVLAARHQAILPALHGPLGAWDWINVTLGSRAPIDRLLATFAYTSVLWTALNLLPVIPLDGGHILEMVLALLRRKPAPALANGISAAIAVLLALASWFWLGSLFMVLFFGVLAAGSIARARAMSRGGPAAAQQPGVPGPEIRAEIEQALRAAWDRLGSNDLPGALELAANLERAPDNLRQSIGARIRAGVALTGGDLHECARQAGRAFSLYPHAEAAVLAARAALRLGEQETAKTWLRRARESGANPAALAADPELGPLA